jgi:hypothetical protein
MASKVNRRLCRAAEEGDVAGIAAAVLVGADPNAFEGTQVWTPLQLAAFNGHAAAIAALLAAGARVDGTDRDGFTPLMLAAHNGHTAAVDALLAAGADVRRATSDGGGTALHRASMNGHLDAAGVLLEAGARADVRNREGQRPIDGVRAPTRSLDAAAPLHLAASPPRRRAQVVGHGEATKAALRALLASAAPWPRRRPVALACFAVEWEWEE